MKREWLGWIRNFYAVVILASISYTVLWSCINDCMYPVRTNLTKRMLGAFNVPSRIVYMLLNALSCTRIYVSPYGRLRLLKVNDC